MFDATPLPDQYRARFKRLHRRKFKRSPRMRIGGYALEQAPRSRFKPALRDSASAPSVVQHRVIGARRFRYKTEAPSRFSRDLLIGAVAYRLQERALTSEPVDSARIHSHINPSGNELVAVLPKRKRSLHPLSKSTSCQPSTFRFFL